MSYPPSIRRNLLTLPAWACLLLASPTLANASLTFNLGTTGNANADAGFRRAADFLSARFTDDITIDIDTGFEPLSSGILAQAGSSTGTVSFADWKGAIADDRTTPDDTTFSANLPTGNSFSLYINRTSDNPNGSGSATPYLDNDGGANNRAVSLTFANAKALGIAVPAGFFDAAITFSSNFSFDFDPSNGIDPGSFDFVGVATHELIHALGFTSGVDRLDQRSPPLNGPFNDDTFTNVTALDFTRQSAASRLAGADIDWTADNRPKDFTLDGTLLIPNAWSTGINFGDGQQASHWKDNLGLGIMDPTAAPGELLTFSLLDRQALDVIGYDAIITAVPEPGTYVSYGVFTLFALGFFVHRRQAAKTPC